MKRIVLDTLQEHDACASQMQLFSELFPEGAEVTQENARKARAAGLDIGWAAEALLPGRAFREFRRRRAEAHDRLRAGLDALHRSGGEDAADRVDGLWAEYDDACADAFVAVAEEFPHEDAAPEPMFAALAADRGSEVEWPCECCGLSPWEEFDNGVPNDCELCAPARAAARGENRDEAAKGGAK